MPSAVSLPTFSEREKLLFQKLNALVASIEARFTAGIGAADLSWPLTAEGHLNMSTYDINDGSKIWGLVNANTYIAVAGQTLQAAVNAAGAGGVVVVPPDTTIVTDGGVDLSTAPISAIIGFGPSSVIKRSASAAAATLLVSSGTSDLMISNLTLDGNSVAGKTGLDVAAVTNLVVSNVWFKNFGGAAFKGSGACDGLFLSDCFFTGGAGYHIHITRGGTVGLKNIKSTNAAETAVLLAGTDGSATIHAFIDGLNISGCAKSGLVATGHAAVGTTSVVEVYGSDIKITANSNAVDQVILGTSTTAVEHVALTNCRVNGSLAGGVLVNANTGTLSNLTVDDPATYCIDLDTSVRVSVNGGLLRSGTIGIDGSGVIAGSKCVANDVTYYNCTTDALPGAGFWPYGFNSQRTWTLLNNQTFTTGGTSDFTLVTLPAWTLKPGDVLVVEFAVVCSGVNSGANAFSSSLGTQVLDTVPTTTAAAASMSRATLVVKTDTTGRTFQESWASATPTPGSGDCTTLANTTSQALKFNASLAGDVTSGGVLVHARATLYSGVGVTL